MSLMFFCFNTNTTYAEEVCASGWYVASCSGIPNGNITVPNPVQIGTNLLKGFYYTDPDTGTILVSPNYYDYSMEKNMENLSKFFKGTEPLKYYDHNHEEQHVGQSTYKDVRKKFFQTYCPDQNHIVCAKCPNGGKTGGPSTIDPTVAQIDERWDLKVISDCYVSKYTDSTGSYEYITSEAQLDEKVSCFYDTDVPGNQIVPNHILFQPENQTVQDPGGGTADD